MTATGQLITVDVVRSVEPGQRAVGVRHVPNTLAILDSHFPNFPVLPGVLILGSLGELAAELVGRTAGGSWHLAGADTVRYRHFVQPGDTMELTVELTGTDADGATCKATARVGGKPVTTVRRLYLHRQRPDLDVTEVVS